MGVEVENLGSRFRYGKTQSPQFRQDYIMREFLSGGHGFTADRYDDSFVQPYLEETGATFTPTNFGAHKSDMLARDLKALYDLRLLKRNRLPIPYDLHMCGFGRWVWNYRLRYPATSFVYSQYLTPPTHGDKNG